MKRFSNKPWPWAMVLLACMAGAARADDVVIGAASGWKLGVTYTDHTIKQGDTLVRGSQQLAPLTPSAEAQASWLSYGCYCSSGCLTASCGPCLQVFNYNPSAHDVYRLPSGACNFDSSAVRVDAGSSPARVTLDQPGTYWYACSKPGHCDGGMLQKVVVEAAVGEQNNSRTHALVCLGVSF